MMKGHMHSRRKWMNVYVVMAMVCLVLGCGVLGLMGLHRLKQRRILNHLIKEKDDQILSLHRLLQKEREHLQEAKRKTEEMKIKLYNLRSQKTELNSRVLEMQSTISSLRDEQRAIESAYQEKQNEAKLLREQYTELKDQNPHVKALTEALAEIEDLKHHRSVGTDEHMIVPENVTAKANMSMNDTGEEGRSIKDRGETIGKEEAGRVETARANGRNQQVGSSETGIEKKEYLGNEMQKKPEDDDGETRLTDSKEVSTVGDGHSSRISRSQRTGNQDFEMEENSNSGHYRFIGKQGYLKRVNGKRWRLNAKQTEEKKSLHSNGASILGDQSIVEGEKPRNQNTGLRLQNESVSEDAVRGEEMSNVKGHSQENNGESSEDSPPEIKSQNIIKLEENTEDTSHRVGKLHTNSSSDKPRIYEQKVTITEHAENNEYGEHNNHRGRKEIGETNEDADGIQMEHFEESEVGEEKEQTDEPEF